MLGCSPAVPCFRAVTPPLAVIAAVLLLGVVGGCLPVASSAPEGMFRVRPAGAAPERIGSAPVRPIWSPDGDRIAWSAADGLWIAQSDGTGAHRIVNERNLATAAWAPDGETLAVVDNAAHLLRIVGANGEPEQAFPLVEQTQSEEFPIYVADNTPSWSPDGTQIAFTAWDGNGDEIFRIDRDGASRTQLSHVRASTAPLDGEHPNGPRKAFSDAGRPGWAPGGDVVAYALFPELRDAPGGVYVVAVDSGRASRLAPLTPLYGPVWSPDGRRLLFVYRGKNGADLFIVDSITRRTVNLTQDSDLSPRDGTWSPDGDRIAFSADDGALYVMTLANRTIAPLADTPLDDIGPVWSPDGQWIAFRAQHDLFADQPSLPHLP
ncbi:MAG: PD40 domain-containing protein [Thermomicrobiales bacterium]|nr:PD40 domain-containing protein [Thermomicrobiales bacterium]